jgi:hypothetical protein
MARRDLTISIVSAPVEERLRRNWQEARAERDRYIRAFNRLEKAVTNHMTDRCIDSDDLEHVHRVVMRDLRDPDTHGR